MLCWLPCCGAHFAWDTAGWMLLLAGCCCWLDAAAGWMLLLAYLSNKIMGLYFQFSNINLSLCVK
jgi:hypothetical protein